MKKHRHNCVIELCVVIMVLATAGVCWWPLITSDVKPWQQGRAVPETRPSETRRVRNVSAEFSIVVPRNWNWSVSAEQMLISSSPKRSIPGRSAVFTVRRLPERPTDGDDWVEYDRVMFQGKPAWFAVRRRGGTWDDPAGLDACLLFERGSCWFQIAYSANSSARDFPPVMWSYFETFRFEPGAEDRSSHDASPEK